MTLSIDLLSRLERETDAMQMHRRLSVKTRDGRGVKFRPFSLLHGFIVGSRVPRVWGFDGKIRYSDDEDVDLVSLDESRPVGAVSSIRQVLSDVSDVIAEVRTVLSDALVVKKSFQDRVGKWMNECFSFRVVFDRSERSHRFLEEALELVQACGTTASEAHCLVDYVFGRKVGEVSQEVGGVAVTLAALCTAQALELESCAETELSRVWTKIEQIRAKNAAKPKFSPLPE